MNNKITFLYISLFLIQVTVYGTSPITDYSCGSDVDCVVKNVGNCCGYYPQCVNKAFTPDPDAVKAWCRDNDMLSVCGWMDIDYCVCTAGRCSGRQGQLPTVTSTTDDDTLTDVGVYNWVGWLSLHIACAPLLL